MGTLRVTSPAVRMGLNEQVATCVDREAIALLLAESFRSGFNETAECGHHPKSTLALGCSLTSLGLNTALTPIVRSISIPHTVLLTLNAAMSVLPLCIA